jgi:hypothetical protein
MVEDVVKLEESVRLFILIRQIRPSPGIPHKNLSCSDGIKSRPLATNSSRL